MKRFRLTIEFGTVKPHPDPPREGQADALVELSDPDRQKRHELDHRPIGLGFGGAGKEPGSYDE